RSMGLEASGLGHVVDVMAKAMSTANTDMLQLGDAFKFVGPVARSAGFSLEEITAAIQVLSDAGVQGEMAGTTLRGMILSLSDVGKAPALAQLGVRVRDAVGNFRPLADIMEDFQRALQSRGTFDLSSALGGIFENRQVTGAMTLIADGADKLRARTKALQEAAGTGARISAIQLDTLTGSVKIFLSALQDVAIELGGALAPPLRVWAGQLVEALNVTSTVIKHNKELFLGLAKGALILIGAGAVLIGLGLALKVVGLAVGGFALAWSAVGLAVTMAVKSLLFVLTPLGLLLKTVDSMITAFAFSKEGRASLEAWGDAFRAMADDARTAWGGIINAVRAGDLELAGRIAMAGLKSAWEETVAALKVTWAKFASWWQQRVETARANFALLIHQPVPNAQEGLAFMLAQAGEAVGVLPEGAAAQVRQAHRERVAGDPVRRNIIQDHQAQIQAIEQEEAARVAAIQREGNQARAQLQALVQQAAVRRAQPLVQAAAELQRRVPGAIGGRLGGGDPRNVGLPAIDMGTFSAHVARLLGGAKDVEEKQLDQQIDAAERLKKIQKLLEGIELLRVG
ncbi:MAG: phage tail tape measure protein, partial [Gemmataceae bacterium]